MTKPRRIEQTDAKGLYYSANAARTLRLNRGGAEINQGGFGSTRWRIGKWSAEPWFKEEENPEILPQFGGLEEIEV